jgi:hypothetical protein
LDRKSNDSPPTVDLTSAPAAADRTLALATGPRTAASSRPKITRPSRNQHRPGTVGARRDPGVGSTRDRVDQPALIDHPVYGERMRQHAAGWFAGATSAEYPF